MIPWASALTQQSVLERAIAEVRLDRYPEAWELAASGLQSLEGAQARTYVRYHAGDLEAALAEAARGLEDSATDPWLLATSTEIALSLHRGPQAERLLARWQASAPRTDAPRIEQAARELSELRAAESLAQVGTLRARWISALGTALALTFLLLFARQRD